jgi:Rrf2 family protein
MNRLQIGAGMFFTENILAMLKNKEIAKNQGISVKYLDHIIHALKVSGLIQNVKGKKSGYTLVKKPGDISLYEILNAFEPGICVVECLSKSVACNREKGCAAKGFWGDLNNKIIDHFKSVSLADLVNKQVELVD